MRILSSNALAKAEQQTGTEPFNTVEIDWPIMPPGEDTGFRQTAIYSDRTMPDVTVEALILDIGNLDEIVKLSDKATASQVSITLDDQSGYIKRRLDSFDIQKRPVRIYQMYEGLNYGQDKFLVFDGEIVTPIVWSERQRKVTFEAITRARDVEVGFAPEEGQFKNVGPETAGKVWPLCFGSPINVPATLAELAVIGSLMTRMGVPDPTLKYKKELLLYRKEQIQSAIDHYKNLVEKNDKKSRPAYKIQEAYANHIVAYDGLKQIIEDNTITLITLNSQLDKLNQEWTDPEGIQDRSMIEDRYRSVRDTRNKCRAILKGLVAQRRQFEQSEKAFKLELDNSKFYSGLSDRIKKKTAKLKKDLAKIEKEISIVTRAIDYQSKTLNKRVANVWDGTKFPQDEELRYDINNAIFQATMSGRILSFHGIVAKYVNIELGDRQDESPDLFWLDKSEVKDDPIGIFRDKHNKGQQVDLTNMYCQAKMKDGSKRIIKVVSQRGEQGQCKIDLPPKIVSKAASRREINYDIDALDKEAFDEGLNRLLSGSETPEQVAEIANNIPKDLSPKIWKILHGNKLVQYVELLPGSRTGEFTTDFSSGSFIQLIYGDEEVSDRILFTDSAITIRDKITKSILQLPPESVKVTIEEQCADSDGELGFKKLKIEFTQGLMKPFRINEVFLYKDPLELNSDTVVITRDPNTDITATLGVDRDLLEDPNMELSFSGDIWIFLNGRIVPLKAEDLGELDGATLQSYLEDMPTGVSDDPEEEIRPICAPGEITCTGGPLKTSNIVLTFNTDFKPLLIDSSRLGVGKNSGEISLKLKLGPMVLDEDKGLNYQRLYFDRNELLNPESPLTLSGKFTLNFGPYAKEIDLSTDPDGGSITNSMIASNFATSGTFLAAGGPLSVEDIKIYQLDVSNPVSILPTTAVGKGVGLEARLEEIDFKSKFDPIKPQLSLVAWYDGQGASEFTDTQRQTKLKEAIDKNINAPAIHKFRNKVLASLKEFREDLLEGKVDEYWKDVVEYQHNLSVLASVANKIEDSALNLEEYFRLISEDERKMLYELEILGYLEWKLKLKQEKELDSDEEEEDSQYEYTAKDIEEIIEASPVVLQKWLEYLDLKPKPEDVRAHKSWKMKEISLLPNSTSPFVGEIGDKVTIENEFQEKYICNCLPSQIKAVHAWKTVDGIRRLVPLSKNMYIKNENDETYGEVMTVTSITLKKPLKLYDSKWEDGLYVSLVSSVGPNVVDVIKYIVQNYTTCDVDDGNGTTFDTVRDYQENYPVNFAILDKVDAFALIEDIAWQARCKIWIKEQITYIMYLPAELVSVANLNETNIEEGSLEMSFTPTEDVFTKLTALWKPDYSKEKDWSITVRRNLWRYGENSEERRIFIYNNEDLVYKSITFWLIRWSNTYKMAKCRVFLDNIMLETNDAVTFDVGNPFTTGSITGQIISSEYDTSSNSIDLIVWLPVLSGTTVKYDFANPKDLSSSRRFPDPPDIKNGDAGNPYGVTIPTGQYYDPFDPELEQLRPKDFGKPDISDIDDELPQNPISEFDEVSYNIEPDSTISDMTRYHYSYIDIDNEPWEIEQKALQFQAQDFLAKTSKQDDILVTYGRVLKQLEVVVDETPEGGDPDLITSKVYYSVELTNGKIVKARAYQSPRSKVTYNQVVLVVKDHYSHDYVFQPNVTNGAKDFTGVTP